MKFRGEATEMGTSLELSDPEGDLHISIRRADGRSDPLFLAFNREEVTAADVAQFMPEWKTLTWRRIADSMFSCSKSRADGTTYEITVSSVRESPSSHETIIGDFERFMESASDD